jgi:hypothetical protein
MGGFMCPTCKAMRHIDDSHVDPRLDACWKCGTKVPYSEAELAGFYADAVESGIWPGLVADPPRAD